MKDIAAVVAATATSRGIGIAGQLPWRLPEDMAHFKKITSTPPTPGLTNAVIMGRKTWESIPPKFRPLPSRTNVVLTRNDPSTIDLPEGKDDMTFVASSLNDAIQQLGELPNIGDIFIIGGGQVYKEAIDQNILDRIFYTEVKDYPVETEDKLDAFFPEVNDGDWKKESFQGLDNNVNDEKTNGNDWEVSEKTGIKYRFLDFKKKSKIYGSVQAEEKKENEPVSISEGAHINPEEMQYLDLCRDIIENGTKRGDRTGTGTLSKFGVQMRYSLRDNTLPLITTKRTFWRGVAEELLWFISGDTDANALAEKDIHIWDGNGSREFLDQRGLSHREVGDLGPVYGFQWRHFGAEYVDMHTDYSGKGVDQLAECIHKIKNNPEDRRIIMSAWNPADLSLMALPPCHMFCQFFVDTNKNELSCQMYQRSADMGLGVPFNIASYALLTHMVAHVCDMKPGDFIHTIGDAHVYLNHVDALKEQLTRPPRAFPKLKISNDKKDIDGFNFADFEVIGYKPHKTIKMKMAV